MSVYATAAGTVSDVKLRWEEPFLTSGVNRKALVNPEGVYRGFVVQPTNPISTSVEIGVDPDLGDALAVVHDLSGVGYATTVHTTSGLTINLNSIGAITANGSQTGVSATFAAPVSGVQAITGLTGTTAQMVGKRVTISGAANSVNNGVFIVAAESGGTSLSVVNASGVAEGPVSINWRVAFQVWVALKVNYTQGSSTSFSFVVVDAGDLSSQQGLIRLGRIDLANAGAFPNITAADITFADLASEYSEDLQDATQRPWSSGSTGFMYPGFRPLAVPSTNGVSLTANTKVALTGRFFVGTGGSGTATQYFGVAVAGSGYFTDHLQSLTGTDGQPIKILSVRDSGDSGILVPATNTDVDAFGFYADPILELDFSETTDVNYTGTVQVLAYEADTVGNIASDAFARSPRGILRAASETPLYPSAFTRVPVTVDDVQEALEEIDARLTGFNSHVLTIGPTGSTADYTGSDQAPFNAALAALPTTGGEIIVLPGTYSFTAGVTISKSDIKIRGLTARGQEDANDNGVIIVATETLPAGSDCFVSTGNAGLTFENLTFKDTATTRISTSYYIRVAVTGISVRQGFFFNNCLFEGNGIYSPGGIELDAAGDALTDAMTSAVISGCTFRNLENTGVRAISTDTSGTNNVYSVWLHQTLFRGYTDVFIQSRRLIVDANVFSNGAATNMVLHFEAGATSASTDEGGLWFSRNFFDTTGTPTVALTMIGAGVYCSENTSREGVVLNTSSTWAVTGATQTVISQNILSNLIPHITNVIDTPSSISVLNNVFLGGVDRDLLITLPGTTTGSGHDIYVDNNKFLTATNIDVTSSSTVPGVVVIRGNVFEGAEGGLRVLSSVTQGFYNAHVADNLFVGTANAGVMSTSYLEIDEGLYPHQICGNSFYWLDSSEEWKIRGACAVANNVFKRAESSAQTRQGVFFNPVGGTGISIVENVFDFSDTNLSGSRLVLIDDTTSTTTSGLIIQGNRFLGPTARTYTQVVQSSDTIQNSWVSDNYVWGFESFLSTGTYNECVLSGNQAYNIENGITATLNDSVLVNSVFVGGAGSVGVLGVDLAGASNSLTSNRIEFFDVCIDVSGVLNTLTGNSLLYIDGATHYGVYLDGADDCVVSNNTIGGTGTVGECISLNGAVERCVFVGNTFHDCAKGIYIPAAAQNNIVVANLGFDNVTDGIDNTGFNTVSGNNILS